MYLIFYDLTWVIYPPNIGQTLSHFEDFVIYVKTIYVVTSIQSFRNDSIIPTRVLLWENFIV